MIRTRAAVGERPAWSRLAHLAAMLAFASITWLWVQPLHGRWGTALVGGAPGDNVIFVWNVWWTRYALLHGLSPFVCPVLLYPFGADLTLHTLTLLPAIAVAFVQNPLLAQNVLIVCHLFLNFALAYALAFSETRHQAGAFVAALVFGWSPYIAGHLAGHFNLIAAWVLPLSAWLARRAARRPTALRGLSLGAAIAMTAYVDYYYFVYALLLSFLLVLAPYVRAHGIAGTAAGRGRWAVRGLLTLATGAAGVAMAVFATGGRTVRIAHMTISLRSAWNPLALAWLCLLAAAGVQVFSRWRLRVVPIRPGSAAVAAAAALTTGVLPLALHAIRLARTGMYVTQAYGWRSAPAGVDLLTLFAGNPSSVVYGKWVQRLYGAAGTNLVEHVAWLSPPVVALAVIGLRRKNARVWVLPLVAFSVWALGPFLHAGAAGTPLWLPAVLVRWIPVVANARIPARAIVVVYLGVAVLSAFGIVALTEHRRTGLAALLALCLCIDLLPAPPATLSMPHPSIIEALARAPHGAILDVPFGVRDGFGETGALDPMAMWLQTLHEQPIAGGFVARLPRDVAARYEAQPILASVLRLSAGGHLTPEQIAADRTQQSALADEGFAYVLVNTQLATDAARDYVSHVLPVIEIGRDGVYTLYALAR